MAEQLVENLAEPFDPERYTDDYRANLMKIIKAKMKGKKPKLEEPEEEAPDSGVLDLMSRLRASLEEGNGKKAVAQSEDGSRAAASPQRRRRRRRRSAPWRTALAARSERSQPARRVPAQERFHARRRSRRATTCGAIAPAGSASSSRSTLPATCISISDSSSTA